MILSNFRHRGSGLQSYHSCSLSLTEPHSVTSHATNESAQTIDGISSLQCSSLIDGEQSILQKQRSQIQKLMVKCREQKKCIMELQEYIDELEQEMREKEKTIQRISGDNFEEESILKTNNWSINFNKEGGEKHFWEEGLNDRATSAQLYLQKQHKFEKERMQEQLKIMKDRWEGKNRLKEQSYAKKEQCFHQQIVELEQINDTLTIEVLSLKKELESVKELKSLTLSKNHFILRQSQSTKENKNLNVDFQKLQSKVEIYDAELKKIKKENKQLRLEVQNLKMEYQFSRQQILRKQAQFEQLKLMKNDQVRAGEREREELESRLRLKEAEIEKMRSQLSVREGARDRGREMERSKGEWKNQDDIKEKEQLRAIRRKCGAELEKMDRLFSEFQFEL